LGARQRFELKQGGRGDGAAARDEVTALTLGAGHAAAYRAMCADLGWAPDEAGASAAEAQHVERLAALDAKHADAKENLGDVEIFDALLAKAQELAAEGAPRTRVVEAFDEALAGTVATGHKLDICFQRMVLCLADHDLVGLKELLDNAQKLLDEGGDWERKNRLKVYQGVYFMAVRDFKRAAELLLSSVATFASSELFSYERFVFYTVVVASVALPRTELKAKVVDAPEILSAVGAVPHLESFLSAFHGCRYAEFMRAFSGIEEEVRWDMYLHPHHKYFLREMRLAAYRQFLESYKSVTLTSMASAFGVGEAFLDAEVAEFIAAGRLPCRIDHVNGVLETTHPDGRNASYRSLIKGGDTLLNRVQKLAKVIDME